MKILYCSWDEVTREDAYQALTEMNHQVSMLVYQIKDYNRDPAFSKLFQQKLEEENYDLIFSFNFVPLIAKLAFAAKIKYVSWIYDGMPLTLYSIMAFSPYNYIFTFDRKDCEVLKKRGLLHVLHLPLGVNAKRVRRLLEGEAHPFETQNEVAFIGSLYNNGKNMFDSMRYLPDCLKNHIDSMIFEQLKTSGNDWIREMTDESLTKELCKYASIEMSEEYTWTHKDIFYHMILTRASGMERIRLLRRLSEEFAVALYTGSDSGELPKAANYGYVDYDEKMPLVIANTKINLHITPRTITSGMSLRILDIMAAGGFLLSNRQPELLEYFEEGKDFAVYEDAEDLVEKVSWYLNHEEERRAIAANGKRKAEKNFTYQMQFQKMFDMLERCINERELSET